MTTTLSTTHTSPAGPITSIKRQSLVGGVLLGQAAVRVAAAPETEARMLPQDGVLRRGVALAQQRSPRTWAPLPLPLAVLAVVAEPAHRRHWHYWHR